MSNFVIEVDECKKCYEFRGQLHLKVVFFFHTLHLSF